MKPSLAWPARWMRMGMLSPLLAQCRLLRQPASVDIRRGQMTSAELAELKAGHLEAELPWPQSPEDWQLAK